MSDIERHKRALELVQQREQQRHEAALQRYPGPTERIQQIEEQQERYARNVMGSGGGSEWVAGGGAQAPRREPPDRGAAFAVGDQDGRPGGSKARRGHRGAVRMGRVVRGGQRSPRATAMGKAQSALDPARANRALDRERTSREAADARAWEGHTETVKSTQHRTS